MDDIKKMKEFHFDKKHLFINADFGYYRDNDGLLTDLYDNHFIHEDHRVHIFISYDYSSINDGSLEWFIDFCNDYSLKKVIIHISRSNIEIANKVKKILKKKKNYKMIIHKDHKQIPFVYSFYGEEQIGCEIYVYMNMLYIKPNKDSFKYYIDNLD